jgi:hypothetical protein
MCGSFKGDVEADMEHVEGELGGRSRRRGTREQPFAESLCQKKVRAVIPQDLPVHCL